MPSLQNDEQQQLPNALLKWTQEYETTLALRFPLHRACRDGDLGTLSHLLSSESPQPEILFTTLDPFCGWTPPMWAAFFGQLECLQRVTCAGPVLAARSLAGMTALHTAALGGHPACLHWLLKLGATHHLTDAQGETALHKAVRSRSQECSGLLAVCGADYSARNIDGLTPSQIAYCVNNKNQHVTDNKKQQSPVLPSPISSNGYYGYQILPMQNSSPNKNGTTNGHALEDAAMDSEDNPIINCECQQPACLGHMNGQDNGHTNGLNVDSNNGRKRSMQETVSYLNGGESIKKMRHEANPAPPRWKYLLELWRTSSPILCLEVTQKHERSSHREYFQDRSTSISDYVKDLSRLQSPVNFTLNNEEDIHCEDLLLKGTHGCDLYSFMRQGDL